MAGQSEPKHGHLSLLRVRAAVLLTASVAVLSVVTGIVNIGATTVAGPLAKYVPMAAARTAGFTGTMTGFLMLASAYGLRRGYRSAWYSTVVLLPVTAIQGLVQSSVLSLPLVILSGLAMPAVLLNRRYFGRHVDLTLTQMASLAAIVGVYIYGTVGTYALREEFGGVNTPLDAFYFTLVTASTVGYGDITAT
ncbi:MAG: voltage-gated potassium channel, partial [Natronomonas sp.]|uniref:ion channel n=1 Tax=Natronomonas sp. TaxID=2184060 RepID=UPI003988FB78